MLTLNAVRSLALHAQGLTHPDAQPVPPTPDAIQQTVERLGCVQIDTLHVVQRSHYLVLWSRLGTYAPADFERLAFEPDDRRLFEGWQRCASYIPLKDFRYQLPRFQRMQDTSAIWYHRWLALEQNREMVPQVLERIQQEGGLRTADFKYDGPRRGSWWDWKPAKVALEYHFDSGRLMIGKRVNFQRVYDLTERVLPEWVETTPPTPEERDRYWIEQGARALGICHPMQAVEYSYRKRTPGKVILEELLREGVLMPVQAEQADGKSAELVVHRDNLELMQQAADGALKAERTTFLSPFDSLFWAKGRDAQLWNFRHCLEAYIPEPKRQWGYFCLSILHKGRLVGKFDPKLERQSGILRLKALYLEPGIALDEELVHDVASAMSDFMRFHKAKELVVEKSQPVEFGLKLTANL
ncbi:MAG: hypothetical protein A2W36_01370 [Chloroflexi bacterium RBG_16_58_14]|nr:MAG: hypothetical protein A2W36_01370 [Chloroflexi bacterium RBG_16_58_14]